jgi:hypothetical protein
MRLTKLLLLFVTVFTMSPGETSGTAFARDSRSNPGVIAFGEAREQIRNTPIEKRPDRPLHVYGNSVRRRNSRAYSGPRMSGQR